MSHDSTSFDEGLLLALLGRAIHAAGTRSLDGMAELTFYDTMIAVAAAEGARRRAAWIIEREVKPASWKGEERIDLVVRRKSGANEPWVLATELKWWRQSDGANSANRRKALLVDLLRAACARGFLGIEEEAYVVLISTETSWKKTTTTTGSDSDVCAKLNAAGTQSWSLDKLRGASALKGAVAQLRGSIQLPSSFHTTLVQHQAAPAGGGKKVEVRVWRVRKPQKSKQLDDATLTAKFGAVKTKGSATPSAVPTGVGSANQGAVTPPAP